MIKLVPYYPNSADNTHCFQAVLKMILKYYFPSEDYSWKQLEKISAKAEGLWTWPMQGILTLRSMGLQATVKSTFEYQKFVDMGEEYLIERYGAEIAGETIKNSDIRQEQEISKKYIAKVKPILEAAKYQDLVELTAKDNLVICNVNYYSLYNKPGYAGHFVLVYKANDKEVTMHEPGLPGKKALTMTKEQFLKAWYYTGKDSAYFAAFTQ